MTTIGDVRGLMGSVNTAIRLYGVTEEFGSEFERRLTPMREVLRAEHPGFGEPNWENPGDETPVSVPAEAAFSELKQWLREADPYNFGDL
ncbi:MAG TPA: hypothetical protein VJ837_01165 [Candidatus Paceibacterota bacterium]|nr:hypothetical protein [Candidatus Paceibacterota bacterium]